MPKETVPTSPPPLFILPTAKQFQYIWLLAWPLILSNLSVPLLGLVDTAIMGHLSNARYLGAVSVGATVITFIYWAFGFLRMGTVGLTAQAVGAKDTTRQWQMLYLPVLLALGLGVLIVAFSPWYLELALVWMQAGEDIVSLAYQYLSIRIYSAPAVLITYVAIGWLLGQQNSRGPLLILVITNLSNIAFNLIFVWGVGLNSAGVAWGSLLADYLGFATAIFLVWRQVRHSITVFYFAWHQSHGIIKELININGVLFVRTSLLLFGFAFITAQSAKMGTNVLAANTILLQYIALLAYFLDGFAHAAEASCGKAIGKKQASLFYQTVNAVGLYALCLSLISSLGFYFFQTEFIHLLTSIPEVIVIASEYAVWVVFIPVINVWSYLMDGVFVGATKSPAMFHSVWTGVFTLVFVWYLLNLTNHHLWLAFTLFCLVRALVAIGLYLRIRHQQAWW